MIRTCDNGHAPVRLESGMRCTACERRRLSRQARGYDATHQRARAALLQQVDEAGGSLLCGYGCGRRVTTRTVVAAHVVDGQPANGWIASCRSCNERAKRKGWGGIPGPPNPANTRARLLAPFPTFGGRFRADERGRTDVGPRAPQGAGVAR